MHVYGILWFYQDGIWKMYSHIAIMVRLHIAKGSGILQNDSKRFKNYDLKRFIRECIIELHVWFHLDNFARSRCLSIRHEGIYGNVELCLGVERAEKICVGSGIGYVSWNQKRVRVRFNRCGLAKLLNIFRLVWRNMPIGSQAINRVAIFRNFSPQRMWMAQ